MIILITLNEILDEYEKLVSVENVAWLLATNLSC